MATVTAVATASTLPPTPAVLVIVLLGVGALIAAGLGLVAASLTVGMGPEVVRHARGFACLEVTARALLHGDLRWDDRGRG